MKTTHSFSTDFLIRRCKENKKRALIYARITVDEERKEISLKEQIDAADWDPKKEIVKGKTEQVKSINQYIEDVRYKIKEKYRLLYDKEILITAETVKQAYLGTHALLKGHKLVELMDYYNKIWEPKLKPGGFKNVRTTTDYVKRFLGKEHSDSDIFLSQLNIEFITNLEHYIRDNPIKDHDPCKGNGLAKHIQRFKRIISWAKEIEWIKEHPVKDYKCVPTRTRRKKLTIQQLVAIEEQPFADPIINYVKDLFIHSCYAGFAFADAMALRESHFEWDTDSTVWCKIYRQKSDELSAVPILQSAAVILIPLTFHIARHTFAKTVALKSGIPITTVQIMMGHTKITTTMIYADVDEDMILDDTTGWQQKLDQKREIVLAARKLEGKMQGIQQWAH